MYKKKASFIIVAVIGLLIAGIIYFFAPSPTLNTSDLRAIVLSLPHYAEEDKPCGQVFALKKVGGNSIYIRTVAGVNSTYLVGYITHNEIYKKHYFGLSKEFDTLIMYSVPFNKSVSVTIRNGNIFEQIVGFSDNWEKILDEKS